MQNATRRGEIYWFDPAPTIGSEIQKVRPCVVVSPDEMNSLLDTVVVVPLTTTAIPWPFRLVLPVAGQKTMAACDQIRTIDKVRLLQPLGALSSRELRDLLALLMVMFTP